MSSSADRFKVQNWHPSFNVLGIHLGLTNTVAALWRKGKKEPEILTIENEKTISSYVWYRDDNKFDVGKNALRNLEYYPQNIFYDAHLLIGQNYTTVTKLHKNKNWKFNITNNKGRAAYQLSSGKTIEPETILAHILKKIKDAAGVYSCDILEYAVITVPAHFNHAQRQSIMEAAKIAKLTLLELVTEPSAAAYAFNYDHRRFEDFNLFIFDLANNELNITVITVKDGRFATKASGCFENVSGRKFENVLMEELKRLLLKNGAEKFDVTASKIQPLLAAAKEQLMISNNATISCSDLAYTVHTSINITRDKFEQLSSSLISAIKVSCKDILIKANMDDSEINEIILIGESTRMPLVLKTLKGIFQEDVFPNRDINQNEIITYGAAVRGAQLCDSSRRDYDLTVELKIRVTDDEFSTVIINRNIHASKIRKRYFTTKNNQKSASVIIYKVHREYNNHKEKILSFQILNLPQELAGKVYIDIKFQVIEYEILKITAKSRTSMVIKTLDLSTHKTPFTCIDRLFPILNSLNEKEKKILSQFKSELGLYVQSIRDRFKNERNVPYHKKQRVLDDCDECIELLEGHPAETINDYTIKLTKRIAENAKELVNISVDTQLVIFG